MPEISDTSQKLLLAAINLGTAKNAADAAAHAYSEAIGQYNEAFEEYKERMDDYRPCILTSSCGR